MMKDNSWKGWIMFSQSAFRNKATPVHVSSACLDIFHKVDSTIKNEIRVTGYERDGLNWSTTDRCEAVVFAEVCERELSSKRLQSALAGACLTLSYQPKSAKNNHQAAVHVTSRIRN